MLRDLLPDAVSGSWQRAAWRSENWVLGRATPAPRLPLPCRFNVTMPGLPVSGRWTWCLRSLLAVAVAAAWCLALAGVALASTWAVTALPHGVVKSELRGITCPSAALCVAVGGNNTVAASANPTGGAEAWSLVHPGGAWQPPIGSSGEVTFGGKQIKGVSCPTPTLCVAVSFDGHVLSSSDPTGDVSAWKIVKLGEEGGPNLHMMGISCPTSGLCIAVAYGGKVAYSVNPSGEASAWTIVELAHPFDLRGVSCPSASLCVAVGNEGEILSSTKPTGGPSAWESAGAPAGASSMNAVSCPSTTFCVTGNGEQIVYSSAPAAGAGGWRAISAGSGYPIEGISCPSAGACAAIDDNADAIVSTDPTSPAAWWFKNVLPPSSRNGMFALSCPTTSLCVAAGQSDQLLISTDPFAPDAVAKRPGRPTVVITKHPAKRISPHRGGVKVTFRFRAVGSAAGFRCKLRGHGFRPCRSPAHYKVGAGQYAFKVRAVAPGGALGPAAVFSFRVGRVIQRGPVGSCPPGSHGSLHHPCINAR